MFGLEERRGQARELDEVAHLRAAAADETRQGSAEVVALGDECIDELERVEKREVGSLTEMRRGGVRSVADQENPTPEGMRGRAWR